MPGTFHCFFPLGLAVDCRWTPARSMPDLEHFNAVEDFSEVISISGQKEETRRFPLFFKVNDPKKTVWVENRGNRWAVFSDGL